MFLLIHNNISVFNFTNVTGGIIKQSIKFRDEALMHDSTIKYLAKEQNCLFFI